MARENAPTRRRSYQRSATRAARLLVTLGGGLLVWTWATPPASARQVPATPARAVVRGVPGWSGPVNGAASATRVSGNVANTD